LLSIPAELPAHEVVGIEWANRAEHLHLLIADRLVVRRHRRLHGEKANHLEQVVLDDVPDGARLLVEPPTALDPEALRHRDLDAGDVVPVPDRLEKRIGESEDEEVLDRPLPEIVIDPEDRRLVEDAMQRGVQRLRGREIPAEGLLQYDPGVPRAVRATEPLDDRAEEAGWNREIVQRSRRT